MRLELFDLVDKSTRMLQMKQHIFQYVEKTVVDQFKKMLSNQDVDSIAFTSRIKSSKSLKEKMIYSVFAYFPFAYRLFRILDDPTLLRMERKLKKQT